MNPLGRRRAGAAKAARAAAAAAALLLAAATARAQAFSFVALGDMPYGADVVTGPAYRHLIEQINAERPPFAIHVGDFKDGVTECTDALYARQLEYFQRFDTALVYTPGDNDWIDCQRTGADPLERLQALRERFFAGTRSLGRRPIALQRQSDTLPAGAPHARYRENARWWHQGVLFTTFHTLGPDNNAEFDEPALRAETLAREAANADWLRASFALARQQGARALVFATQGDMFKRPPEGLPLRIRAGFRLSIERTLLPLAAASGRPVLLVHGDSHQLVFDQPFVDAQGRTVANLWRLEVFGEPRMHAVRVEVDPRRTAPFHITPIWNPLSPDPRR